MLLIWERSQARILACSTLDEWRPKMLLLPKEGLLLWFASLIQRYYSWKRHRFKNRWIKKSILLRFYFSSLYCRWWSLTLFHASFIREANFILIFGMEKSNPKIMLRLIKYIALFLGLSLMIVFRRFRLILLLSLLLILECLNSMFLL